MAKLIYTSDAFLVINKPSGIQSVSSTLDLHSVQGQLEKKHGFVHINQRLDTPVSGLMTATIKKKAVEAIQEAINDESSTKKYIAICSKGSLAESGRLEHYLIRDGKHNKARITDKEHGKLAQIDYRVLKTLDNYLVLEVTLLTGRFHQIRCQLADQGAFIKGDVKYGARRGNKDRSLYLHAYELSFNYQGEQHLFVQQPKQDPLWDIAWQAKIEHE